MISIKQIVLPFFAAGWLIASQSLLLFAGTGLDLPLYELGQQQTDIAAESSNALYQTSPILPAAIVEAEQTSISEIRPDLRSVPELITKTAPPVSDRQYLWISGRSNFLHPALALLYPFHTYL